MRKKILNSVLFLCFLGGLIFSSASAHAAVWYVDANAPLAGDGKSWATSFRDIQSAINSASPFWMVCMAPYDQIYVRQGTYVLTGQINVNKVVSIYGGFDKLGNRDWKKNITIIDGNDKVRCLNVTKPSVINGFTIKNGNTPDYGGGVYIDSSPVYCSMGDWYHTPIIKNCKITGNRAGIAGGGVYDIESDSKIVNCTFTENYAANFGGGMYNLDSSPKVTDCLFHTNSSDEDGGGMYNWDSSPTITGCIFRDNQARDNGGGIHNGGGSPIMTNCTFISNVAHGHIDPMGGGGGMNNAYSSPIVTNCIFLNNYGRSYGGGMLNYSSWSTVTNCTFWNNSAIAPGGGYGGGMYHFHGATEVINCILWEDYPDEISKSTTSSPPTVTYSDIQLPSLKVYPGTGNINADPLLADPVSEDVHLQPASPCIDAGDNSATYLHAEDFEGDPRIWPAGGTVDMGSDEWMGPPCQGDFEDDGDVDGSDLAVFAADFGRTDCDTGKKCEGDFDNDDDVDGSDLAVFAADFGRTDCP